MELERDKQDTEAFLPKTSEYEDVALSNMVPRKTSRWRGYLRLGFEVLMAVVIILLLARSTITKTGKLSPVPECRILESGVKE